MSSYILEYIPKIFDLIQNNNITQLIVPAGYNANVVIPLSLQENETKTYVVISDENTVLNYQNGDFITYISGKDMITLLLSYLDKNNDINDLCDIIILSELYTGELYYETIFSLWLHLEKLFDGVPRLVILNSKLSEIPNVEKLQIKNPITSKYEYIDVSKDKLYREIAKLIKNKIKLDNSNIVVIVPDVEELKPYLESYDKVTIITGVYVSNNTNKTLLITTPDKIAYNYLPNTKYVIDSMLLNNNNKYDLETAKQHESLINVAKNGVFTRMISQKNYDKLVKKSKYNLNRRELINLTVEIIKKNLSPDLILKNIDKSLINENIKLINKLNLIDIPKLNNFVELLNLNVRNSAFLWHWIRGARFNSRIIEEGKKYDINFEEIEIDESSLFSSIEPYHLPSTSAIFELEKLNPEIIIDATANIGGDSINFMRLFPTVKLTALEIDTKISYILKRNMNNLKSILSKDNDYDVKVFNISAVDYFSNFRYADMIYFDPPWGGRDYIKLDKVSLYLDDISIGNVIKNILMKGMTQLVILKLPINADIDVIKSDIGSFNISYSLYDVENYQKNKVAYQLMFIRSEKRISSIILAKDPDEVELITTINPVFDGIVIASLIDAFDGSYFKFPQKLREYSQSQYDKILADHKIKYFDKYIGYNDLETFLNLWNDYIDHSDDLETWFEENSINYDKFVKLIQTVNDVITILGEYFEINITNIDPVDAVNIARSILASIYSDLTYIDPYKKLYFNELNPSEKYILDKKDGVSKMLENPPLGIIALHTKVFETEARVIRLIDFGIDTDKTGRGLPIIKKENRNIMMVPKKTIKPSVPKLEADRSSNADILKQNPFDILDELTMNHQKFPLILRNINIDINNPTLLKIAKKITGDKSNDLIKILEDFQNVNIDTAWASKTTKSSDRFDDILKYIDIDNINTYLDIGSGDAVDFNFMVTKLNPERSISVDVKDARLKKSFEFHILEINNSLLLFYN